METGGRSYFVQSCFALGSSEPGLSCSAPFGGNGKGGCHRRASRKVWVWPTLLGAVLGWRASEPPTSLAAAAPQPTKVVGITRKPDPGNSWTEIGRRHTTGVR